jgi:hypothetical protein
MEKQFIINDGNKFEFLYKYRIFNKRFFKSLETGEVYFADPADFNDPFDCDASLDLGPEFEKNPQDFLEEWLSKHPMELMLRKAVEYCVTQGDIQALKEMLCGAYRFNSGERNPHSVGIFCMCENYDHLTQWAYYAGSHTGLCLEYRMGEPPFTLGGRVDYDDNFIRFDLKVFENRETARQIMRRKSKAWEHEREVRYFSVDGPGLKAIQKKQLTKIFFGLKADPKKVQRVKEILSRNKYPTKLFRAKKLDDQYGLVFEEMSP